MCVSLIGAVNGSAHFSKVQANSPYCIVHKRTVDCLLLDAKRQKELTYVKGLIDKGGETFKSLVMRYEAPACDELSAYAACRLQHARNALHQENMQECPLALLAILSPTLSTSSCNLSLLSCVVLLV